MKKSIFGTDGVRGRVNNFPMDVETILSLGKAAGKFFRSQREKSRVVIGKDTRLSCYMVESALVSGLCSMGVDTFVVGPIPTPAVAFLTRAYKADAGIVISASHNPYYDNGIKFFSSEGYKFFDGIEKELEKFIASSDDESYLPKDSQIGRNTRIDDANGRYIEFVKSSFPKQLSLRGLNISLDCANGAAYRVAPSIFKELDALVYSYGVDPDGLNINEKCGSLFPEMLQKAVIENQSDIGIALDGDGDRVILIDEKGSIVNGDMILGICALDLKRRQALKNQIVVGTVMSNLGLVETLKKNGIDVVLSKVGDRYVLQKMIEHEAVLGGESSGHMIFLEHNTTGDGLVCALQVLKIMIERKKKLSDLTKEITFYPQVLKNVSVSSKPPLQTLTQVQLTLKEMEEKLGDSGRILLRYSGTEDLCRVMVEGKDRKMIDDVANTLANKVKASIG